MTERYRSALDTPLYSLTDLASSGKGRKVLRRSFTARENILTMIKRRGVKVGYWTRMLFLTSNLAELAHGLRPTRAHGISVSSALYPEKAK